MRRSKFMVASTALGLSLALGACGGGESSDSEPEAAESSESSGDTATYCEDLRAAEEQFSSFGQGDAAESEKAFSTFRALGEEAPEEVADDWATFLAVFDDLETALNDAGIELSDLERIQQGDLPKGVNPQDLQKLGAEVQALAGPEVEAAGAAIEQHAAAECDIQLGQ